MELFDKKTVSKTIFELASCVKNSPDAELHEWQARLHFSYGRLSGQRALVLEGFEDVSQQDAIIAMETAFYLATASISLSAFEPNPAAFLERVGGLSESEFATYISGLVSGDLFAKRGVYGITNSCDFNWLLNANIHIFALLKNFIASCSRVWDLRTLRLPGDDPFQSLQVAFFPTNLCHVTGSFSRQSGWQSNCSLI